MTQTVSICYPTLSCTSGACLSAEQATKLCVHKVGMNACPSGYPVSTVVASSYVDSRTCGSCACGSQLTCSLNGVVLNNDANCGTGHPYIMTATPSCTAGPVSYPLNAVQAVGTSTGSNTTCAETSPSMPEGSVSLPSWAMATVCCK
jgi:hypothetical protein